MYVDYENLHEIGIGMMIDNGFTFWSLLNVMDYEYNDGYKKWWISNAWHECDTWYKFMFKSLYIMMTVR